MKKLISPVKLMLLLPLAALAFMLSSFTAMPGGEGFEVYQNNKLVLQQFGNDMKHIKSIQLNSSSAKDQLTIKYYHCGKAGRDRHITLRTTDNREVKSWQFADITAKDAGMSLRVADVLAVGKSSTLNVYYSSAEIPRPRLLVSLVVNS